MAEPNLVWISHPEPQPAPPSFHLEISVNLKKWYRWRRYLRRHGQAQHAPRWIQPKKHDAAGDEK